ncbi:hypothetical protein ACFWBS_50260 [Streptomyces mirabilis]|uniref:hypothetical protein n=1 Tax=Streptomyces mirabilis TaxID=68239 RepID=UPI00366274B2
MLRWRAGHGVALRSGAQDLEPVAGRAHDQVQDVVQGEPQFASVLRPPSVRGWEKYKVRETGEAISDKGDAHALADMVRIDRLRHGRPGARRPHPVRA